MHDLGHDHRWLLAGSTQATITGAEPTLRLPDIRVQLQTLKPSPQGLAYLLRGGGTSKPLQQLRISQRRYPRIVELPLPLPAFAEAVNDPPFTIVIRQASGCER